MAVAISRNAVVKVVNEHEVENLTRNGWRLDDVLQETHVEPFSESVPLATSPGSYPQNFNATKGFLVTKNRYLMVQDGSKAVAELTQKVAEGQSFVANAQTMQANAEKESARLGSLVKQLEDAAERTARTRERDLKDAQDLRTRNQKMENDISKIRTAMGDLKMKEILES